MNLDSALQTFIIESRELLADMENALLAIEQSHSRDDTVNAIFRAAHTIKGSAGLFSLDHIVTFTHAVESVLDQVRDGKIDIVDDLIVLLLSCCDHIGALIDTVESDTENIDEAIIKNSNALIQQLHVHLDQPMVQMEMPVAIASDDTDSFERLDSAASNHDHWHISLRFGRNVLRDGMDPLSFIRYLGKLGKITGIMTLPDAIPASEEMDPESCYLGFEIAFESDASKEAIESVFEFVRDDCQLRIMPPNSRISEYVHLIQELPEENTRLGEILVRCGTLTAHELEAALDVQSTLHDSSETQPIGAILVEQGIVQPAVVEAALAKQKHVRDAKTQENNSIRVDAEKLDQLINQVGELIIAAASANLAARRSRIDELQETTSTLSHLVEEVRDRALQLRMVKIGATFNRFQRVVHTVSRELGKDIALVVDGEDTELDKTVVEKIADPLTHLVRNAMDHGIEPAEIRLARGKPARGSVKLNAYHDSGCIVIEVSDDGGGLQRDRILAKAIERGLIDPGRHFSDHEIDNLIFEPGFSTADQVTNLSGRGVGMDVVKRNITALRGSVDVKSEEGLGTTMIVRLPLTLAIINGFLVGLGKLVFVIPLDMIEECVEFSAEAGHDYTNLRGEVLPFIRLRELFEVASAAGRRQSIVVLKHAGRKAGLVVDSLLGEFQTVIKPLGKMFSRVDCISGSSILGNGEVALILDVAALFRTIEEKSMRQLAA